MPRGISWDTLPNQFDPYDKLSAKRKQEAVAAPTTPAPQEHVERKFDLVEDLEAIGRRTAFGTVVRIFCSFRIIGLLWTII